MEKKKFILFDDPLMQFNAMLDDIRQAKETILLQTFKFGNDAIGLKFKTELLKKVKEGLKIYILVDAFGSKNSKNLLSELSKNGVNVKLFKKITFSIDLFKRNHRRNHRKLLIIDSKITYIGSSNITDYCINWRESCLRINDFLSHKFRKIFFENYDISDFRFANRKNKKAIARKIKYQGFEIICDVPSTLQVPTRKKFINLINSAKESITITTPYFLCGFLLKNAFKKALDRNVKIKLLIPKNSDVKMFDILRNYYLGKYYNNGVEVIEYQTNNLHAKLLLVDDKEFVLGSSNFDYRSFWWMYEINLCGTEPAVIQQIKQHFSDTEKESGKFNVQKWEKRPFFIKIIEILLLPLRHLF